MRYTIRSNSTKSHDVIDNKDKSIVNFKTRKAAMKKWQELTKANALIEIGKLLVDLKKEYGPTFTISIKEVKQKRK